MAISQNRYVDISSGIAAAPAATRRELIARVMTTNAKVPTGSILEFANASEVSAHFGGTSEESLWANKYFGFISKSFKSPSKISFGRYANENIAASIVGTKAPATIDEFPPAINAGFDIEINGTRASFDGIDFTGELDSLAALASSITTALGDTGTCTYSNGVFSITFASSVNTVSAVLPLSADVGDDISALLGLTAADNPIVNVKVDAETADEAIGRSAEISDNFASFTFISTAGFSADTIRAIAAWAEGQNFKYAFLLPCTASTYSDMAALVSGYTATWLQLATANGQEEFMPASIAAATDYNGRNTTVNYMFQQFGGVTPIVTTNADANTYDAKNVNYYGQTQRAGRTLAFLQRGVMADGTDAGVFFNEVWLKDALQTDLLNLLIGQAKVPANTDGEAMVRGAMLGSIEQAIANGTIQLGKTLNDAQKVTIDMLTGIAGSWKDVQNSGYVLRVTIELDGTTNDYVAKYLLIYSKGDAVRKIEGSDVLI